MLCEGRLYRSLDFGLRPCFVKWDEKTSKSKSKQVEAKKQVRASPNCEREAFLARYLESDFWKFEKSKI